MEVLHSGTDAGNIAIILQRDSVFAADLLPDTEMDRLRIDQYTIHIKNNIFYHKYYMLLIDFPE